MNKKFDAMNFLKNNVRPATGCTEPVAVAYATAVAYSAINGQLPERNGNSEIYFENGYSAPELERIKQISIKTDRDVYKNALSVSIPGTKGQKGMAIASAMGMYCDPSKGLNLFADVDDQVLADGNSILKENKIIIEKVTDAKSKADLDIQVTLDYQLNGSVKSAYVRLQHDHGNITEIKIDGETVYQASEEKQAKKKEEFPETLAEMVGIARELTSDEKKEVYKGIEMNLRMAEEGARLDYGLNSGKTLQSLVDQEYIKEDIVTKVKIQAAYAGDARMGGANMPVMSTAGSGNQGITALIPIAVIGKELGKDKEKISEAAMLSHLVTKYSALNSGHLSAICGCAIKAGMGAAAGVAYLLGGEVEQINDAINLMAANVTGMICDGAKEGCALKLSTAAGVAAESALIALNGVKVPSDNGIIHKKAEDTIKSIGRVSYSMVAADLEIVDIMQGKDDISEVRQEKKIDTAVAWNMF